MELTQLKRKSEFEWVIEPHGKMNVPGIIYADEELIRHMDQKVYEQICNVAALPGIVKASYAMPDAHWGYGFCIGGVAAFDPEAGGIISAGGVGFDIACGVRTIHTGLTEDDLKSKREQLAEILFHKIPAGVGSTGSLHLNHKQMDEMLSGGAQWAVKQGYGTEADLDRTEEHGCAAGAKPDKVSDHAKKRQQDEVGTLGSGNHYLEVQHITDIYDDRIAEIYGLHKGDIMMSIHCGSRGLGHQIGTEFLKSMAQSAGRYGIELPDRELACAPIHSDVGQDYLGAMRAGINCALANRQILTHLVRQAFKAIWPKTVLKVFYDISHNTCKVEEHKADGKMKKLFIHRKGATRAFGPGNTAVCKELRDAGQPVLIGGTMGTASYILAGISESEAVSFSSSCHGAGRNLSRTQATKQWFGRDVVKDLASRGVIIKSKSMRGIAEEAPGAYKDVSAVVEASDKAGLSKKVARLEPLICVKG